MVSGKSQIEEKEILVSSLNCESILFLNIHLNVAW